MYTVDVKRWHRLLDGWLIAGVLFLFVLVALLGCGPPKPQVPSVKPAVAFRPVCTSRDGSMGWTTSLRVNGNYRVKLFNGPYPPIIDYSMPAKAPFRIGGDPNQVYVLTRSVPWVLEYTVDPARFLWVEVSARITTPPPTTCSV